jgi:hypothetical protein
MNTYLAKALVFSAVLGLGVAVHADDDPHARFVYQKSADDIFDLVSEAYQLAPGQQAEVRRLLDARVEATLEWNRLSRAAAMEAAQNIERVQAKYGPGEPIPPEELAVLAASSMDLADKNPLDMKNLSPLIEAMLPESQVAAGRDRLPQIIQERQQSALDEANQRAFDEARRRKQAREAMEEHRRADAPLSESGRPMPKQRLQPSAPQAPREAAPSAPSAPPSRPVLPPRSTQAPAPPQPQAMQPERRVEQPPPPPPPAAPPLDQWDRLADSVAARYSFTAAQRTKAQAILREIRQRAEQYRMAHAADYEQVKRYEDAQVRKAEEKRLNEPLDDLFQEFKERLEQLPTIEQRDSAGGEKKAS